MADVNLLSLVLPLSVDELGRVSHNLVGHAHLVGGVLFFINSKTIKQYLYLKQIDWNAKKKMIEHFDSHLAH